jgi:hypothetical protein
VRPGGVRYSPMHHVVHGARMECRRLHQRNDEPDAPYRREDASQPGMAHVSAKITALNQEGQIRDCPTTT